jgi:cytochrome c biogenesis protein CcmG/thiol:disulfide interchange protein DsbE
MSRKLLALSVVVIAFISGCTQRDRSDTVAADFKLYDLSGKSVKLSDFKGKAVLLDFWATWCPPCRAAIPSIQRLHRNYGGKGLVVLGISTDQGGWDSVKSFVTEYGITYPILKGTADVFSEYQVRTIPMAVLLNREGKIVKRYLGFGGEDDLEKDVKAVL